MKYILLGRCSLLQCEPRQRSQHHILHYETLKDSSGLGVTLLCIWTYIYVYAYVYVYIDIC